MSLPIQSKGIEMLGISICEALPILVITGYEPPAVAFFDENANYISPIVGYHNVQQMEILLEAFFIQWS